MSVRERTRETGILRTLGYTPGEILGMILGESVVIALIGGCSAMRVTAGADARRGRGRGRGARCSSSTGKPASSCRAGGGDRRGVGVRAGGLRVAAEHRRGDRFTGE
jgi:hypothetical protein